MIDLWHVVQVQLSDIALFHNVTGLIALNYHFSCSIANIMEKKNTDRSILGPKWPKFPIKQKNRG